mgnify:CR=1 FL=1
MVSLSNCACHHCKASALLASGVSLNAGTGTINGAVTASAGGRLDLANGSVGKVAATVPVTRSMTRTRGPEWSPTQIALPSRVIAIASGFQPVAMTLTFVMRSRSISVTVPDRMLAT